MALVNLIPRVSLLETEVTSLNAAVASIEQNCCNNLPAPEILIPTACVTPNVGTPISTVVVALETAFCQLRDATGLPNQLFTSVSSQCGGLNTSPSMANPHITMGSIPGWATNVFNLSDSINNLWLTICDIRNSIVNIQTNCCPTGCTGVNINMTATFSGTNITVLFTGSVLSGFADCAPNQLTIKDSGTGQIITTVAVIGNLNGSGIVIPIGTLDPTSSYSLSLNGCFTNGTSTCNQVITYYLVNSSACPTLTVTPTTTTVPWSFVNSITGTITYTVQLWSGDGSILIGSSTATVGPGTYSGIFNTGLSDGTTYLIRVGIQQGVNPIVYCPFSEVTTVAGVYWADDSSSDLFLQSDGSFWLAD